MHSGLEHGSRYMVVKKLHTFSSDLFRHSSRRVSRTETSTDGRTVYQPRTPRFCIMQRVSR